MVCSEKAEVTDFSSGPLYDPPHINQNISISMLIHTLQTLLMASNKSFFGEGTQVYRKPFWKHYAGIKRKLEG